MSALVSIITAGFNKGPFVGDTFQSVLAQSYPSWELLFIDDRSTDNTFTIANQFAARDSRIRVWQNDHNAGANYSRNRALALAKGQYVIFLDADDLLDADCLAKRVERVEANPQLDLAVFTLAVFRNKPGDESGLWQPRSKAPLADFMAHRLPWQTMQPIWKREFLESINGFDEQFSRLQDVELHTRALLQPGIQLGLFNGKPDCYYRIEEQRKNFGSTEFLQRWTRSAIMYYEKFYSEARARKLEKRLLGTLFHAYLHVIQAYRNGKISKPDFLALQAQLMHVQNDGKTGIARRFWFKGVEWYNRQPIRIKGINRTLETMITRG